MILLLAALLVVPFVAFAEPATTNCEKDHAPAVVVPKKKVQKKKEEKKAPPVTFVAPPEVIEKEVIKEVPVIVEKEVIVEKQVIVQVPVPVAAPVVERAPAPVASQPIVKKRPQHVDNAHPLDTDGLASAPLNPPQHGLNNTLTGVALGAGLMYGLSR
jgi:hypothetical protein